jgi:tetratricopeptide (TPR) repeat protein
MKKNPKDPNPAMFIALIRRQEGRLEEAEVSARQSLAIDQHNRPKQHRALARILRQKGDLQGARAEYEILVRLNPDDLEAKRQLEQLR